MNTDIMKADKIRILCLVLSYPFSFFYVYRNYLHLSPVGDLISLMILAVLAIGWLELTIWQQHLLGMNLHSAADDLGKCVFNGFIVQIGALMGT